MKKLSLFISVFMLALTALPFASASAATVARWDFNESTSTHPDSSGNGFTATSGANVQSFLISGTNRGIRTPWVSDIMTKTYSGRLTRVPNNTLLNPRDGNFSITIRFKNTQSYGNVIQKGQSGAVGGYYKWEMPSGRLTCLYRDAQARNIVIKTPSGVSYKNQWVKIKCSLIRGTNGTARAEMVINDNAAATTRTNFVAFGSIENSTELTMMGKGKCDQVKTTCDYFAGDFDYVELAN